MKLQESENSIVVDHIVKMEMNTVWAHVSCWELGVTWMSQVLWALGSEKVKRCRELLSSGERERGTARSLYFHRIKNNRPSHSRAAQRMRCLQKRWGRTQSLRSQSVLGPAPNNRLYSRGSLALHVRLRSAEGIFVGLFNLGVRLERAQKPVSHAGESFFLRWG